MKKNLQNQKWFEKKEKTSFGYKMMFFLLKCFPPKFMRFMAFPIGFFYWLFGKKSRKVSNIYLSNLENFIESNSAEKKKFTSLKHIISFSLNLVENVQSWAGKFSFENVNWQNDDVCDLVKNINEKKGTLLITSHLGNSQMMRALALAGQSGTEQKMKITTILDTNISPGFMSLLKSVNSDSEFNIISSREIGPETIILLQEKLENGEVVVIAGDRTSATTPRYIDINFLEKEAEFPYGVFLMASLLKVPTYFVFGIRHKDLSLKTEYDMIVKKSEIDFEGNRKEREQKIKKCAENFAKELEKLCALHPYQWYNFYDFWQK